MCAKNLQVYTQEDRYRHSLAHLAWRFKECHDRKGRPDTTADRSVHTRGALLGATSVTPMLITSAGVLGPERSRPTPA